MNCTPAMRHENCGQVAGSTFPNHSQDQRSSNAEPDSITPNGVIDIEVVAAGFTRLAERVQSPNRMGSPHVPFFPVNIEGPALRPRLAVSAAAAPSRLAEPSD